LYTFENRNASLKAVVGVKARAGLVVSTTIALFARGTSSGSLKGSISAFGIVVEHSEPQSGYYESGGSIRNALKSSTVFASDMRAKIDTIKISHRRRVLREILEAVIVTAKSPYTSPKFARPPLIEVVCGVLFQSIDAFLVPHFGMLWERKFRDEFPTFRELDPLPHLVENFGVADRDAITSFETTAIPRVWLLDRTENSLVQIQRDRFLYNWKKARPQDQYPRFAQVAGTFFEQFEKLEAFLAEQELPTIHPHQFEITYVNHIPQGQGWETLADIGRVFPDFSWRRPRNGVCAPAGISWTTVLDMPNQRGRLRAVINNAVSRLAKRQWLSLEITVRGLPAESSKESMKVWFDEAHQFINTTFVDLTSAEIRETIWGEQK
jgi:uncharacterized protein (TIGR04255 family)